MTEGGGEVDRLKGTKSKCGYPFSETSLSPRQLQTTSSTSFHFQGIYITPNVGPFHSRSPYSTPHRVPHNTPNQSPNPDKILPPFPSLGPPSRKNPQQSTLWSPLHTFIPLRKIIVTFMEIKRQSREFFHQRRSQNWIGHRGEEMEY